MNRLQTLRHAVSGVELSDFDEQVVTYLAEHDRPTVDTIAGLFRRVRAAGETQQPDLRAVVALLQAIAELLDPAPFGREFEPVLAGRAATVAGVLRGMLSGPGRLGTRAEAATLLLRDLNGGQPQSNR